MKVPCPFFVRTATGRIIRKGVQNAFLSRILEHFIALGFLVGQWNDLSVEVGIFHQTVAQVQQVGVGKPQLFGYRTGAFTFEEAPKDSNHAATVPLCALELCCGEHIEVRGTVMALELEYRLSGIGMGAVIVPSTTRTAERSAMEVGQQPVIAFVLVHEFFYREFHLSFYTKITLQ